METLRFRGRSRLLKYTGFTLIELLVVIAIIAVLVALLLPAVQQAREAARRTQCKNNLKQLALALYNYHDANNLFPLQTIWGYLPPGQTTITSGNQRCGTFLLSILPQLEQQPLFNQTNFSLPIYGQIASNGKTIAGSRVPSLHCPSEALLTGGYLGFENTNYVGNGGPYWNVPAWNQDPYSGVFSEFQNCSIADIKDGTSQTIMLGEQSTYGWTGPGGWIGGQGKPRGAGTGVYHLAFINPATNASSPGGLAPNIHPDGTSGSWWWTLNGTTVVADGPNFIGYWGINSEWLGPSSSHAGGAQFAMADGSTRFINQTVPGGGQFTVWFALTTRAGVGFPSAGAPMEALIGDF
jgi:prepilin-type N-terminal cleavage/methylation domain-containing protein/prepilin-type processing-associated H-X9-DG protein